MGVARVSLPGGRPVPRHRLFRAGNQRGRRSGRNWRADADLGGRGAGGDVAAGGGEWLAGLGLAVAVPVPAGDDAAFAEVVQGAAMQGGGGGGGQAGGGGAGPGAVQAGAAGGGEGDVPGLYRLPGVAALAGGGGPAGGGAGHGADELGAADPGGVLLVDQLR